MKKKLGVLVLTLSTLVISAGCASSGASSDPKPPQPDSSEPKPPQPDSGESWAKAGPSALPSRPAKSAAVQTARFASQ